MQSLDVPELFQRHRTRSSKAHDLNYSVAEAFSDAVADGSINPVTDRIYIPILWSNSYHNYREARNDLIFRAVPGIQKFLNHNLDGDKQYFTVTRCDEGIYENLPENVLVFGACDHADVQIPLVSNCPYAPPAEPKYLASFFGCKRSGGPRQSATKPTFSDYDVGGIGTQIRTKMFEVFKERQDCLLIDQSGAGDNAWKMFSDAMQHTKYALAPRGYAPTSFRLYEAMSLGAVPVYISDRLLLPYSDQLEWSEFCVLCDRIAISELPERLASISEEWRLNAVETLARLYPEYFTLAGTCRQIARYLEAEHD